MMEIVEIIKILEKIYPLRVFEDRDPYRVLIRTILSQRTRDENTDEAARRLFKEHPTIKDIANAPRKRIEELIRPSGFYRVKAERIKEVSQIILKEYDGKVPRKLEDLLGLPGVGRKTANCVLVYGYGEAAIPVDTHVHRISNRLGLVNTKTPEETEEKLREIVPKDYWIELNDLFVQFGQDICKPINPNHEACPIKEYCRYYKLLF